MNYLRKLKNKKGFTLVELIVVIALIAIIVVCMVAFSNPVNSIVRGTKAKSDAITINKIIGDYMERRLSFADQIWIYTEADATNNGNVENAGAATTLSNIANGTIKNYASKGVAGALVLRYVPDTVDPIKSTYKLYDIQITSSGCVWPSTEAQWAACAVFSDDFYNGYEFFLNLDKEFIENRADHGATYNKNKNKLYMGLELTSYDFTYDYWDTATNKGPMITATTLKDDTDNKIAPLTDPDKVRELAEMGQERTGKETVSFLLHNIDYYEKSGTTLPDGTVLSGGMVADPAYFVFKGYDSILPSTDIVFFYGVENYTIENSLS